MTTQAQYNAAGQIMSTISPTVITDPNQIAALTAQGISLVIVPDGKSGSTGSIVNGVYQDYPPAPPAIPNIMAQYVAAQIANGTVQAAQFHPTTIAQLNVALSAVSLTTISTVSASTISTAAPAP